jgi:CheY-like chemotaxis protein
LALAKLLRLRRHQVVVAGTRAEAERKLRHSLDFDLMLCDIGLPDGDGWDLASVAKSVSLPAVAMSAYCMPKDLDQSARAGFALHICKPVDVDVIDKVLEQFALPAAHPGA